MENYKKYGILHFHIIYRVLFITKVKKKSPKNIVIEKLFNKHKFHIIRILKFIIKIIVQYPMEAINIVSKTGNFFRLFCFSCFFKNLISARSRENKQTLMCTTNEVVSGGMMHLASSTGNQCREESNFVSISLILQFRYYSEMFLQQDTDMSRRFFYKLVEFWELFFF